MNPLELADYLVAGVSLLIGIGVGRQMRPTPPEPLKPICSCTHGFGQHHEVGACSAEVRRPQWRGGSRYGYEHVRCPCLRYDGPDPALFGLGTLS